MDTSLACLVDSFLRYELTEKPVWATRLGVNDHDHRLGEFSAADFERRSRQDERWEQRFVAVTDDGLSPDDRIDRDLVVSRLRGRMVMRSWQAWRRDPAIYAQTALFGIQHLFLNRAYDEDRLARCAGARLRAVPGVLAAGRSNLSPDLASPPLVRRAAGLCRSAVAYVRDVVPALVDDPSRRVALGHAAAEAADALDSFAFFLEELAPRATGSHSIGEARYSSLLRENELLDYDAAGLGARGQAVHDELSEELAELASRVAGSSDWREVMARLRQDHPATPEAMLEAYRTCTDRARSFVMAAGLVTMPDGEECLVESSPPFERPVLAVASYEPPPAFAPSRTGRFFVPFAPDGTSPEEVQRRLEAANYHLLPTTTAHEAYPGHHWHHVMLQQNPRPLRRVLWSSFFVEGWALYAERVMGEHGFFTDPRQELAQLNSRIFRAARAVVDTGLHAGELSVEEAVSFMVANASLSEPTARVEVARYCAWPTQAASYLAGALELEGIRARYLGEDHGNLRCFHDTIAGSGALPIALAARALLGDAG